MNVCDGHSAVLRTERIAAALFPSFFAGGGWRGDGNFTGIPNQ